MAPVSRRVDDRIRPNRLGMKPEERVLLPQFEPGPGDQGLTATDAWAFGNAVPPGSNRKRAVLAATSSGIRFSVPGPLGTALGT